MTEVSVTLKGDGSYGHPWLVFKGATVAEVQAQLSEAHENDLFTAAGRAHTAYTRGVMLGSKLDATTVKTEESEEKPAAKKAAAKKSASRPAPSKDVAEAEEATESTEAAQEKPKVVTTPKGAPKPAWKK